MYLYIDESIFNKDGQEYYGVGLLVTEKEVDNNIIREAMLNLKNDPDINEENTKMMDLNTLNRDYFHSADDSKNAHSHLCREITKNIDGVFRYAYMKPHTDNLEKKAEQKHKVNTEIVSLILTEYNQPFNIFIEQRTGLTQENAHRIIDDMFVEIAKSSYSQPTLSAIYPQISIHVVGKENAGIQVVDFILWAVNNNYSNNKKNIWIHHLELAFSSSYDQPEGDLAGGDYILGKGIIDNSYKKVLHSYPDSIFPLRDKYNDIKDFKSIYVFAEQTLKYFSNNGLPKHASHHQINLNKLVYKLNKKTCQSKQITLEVAKTFIQLFDTIPIYESLDRNMDVREFEFILYVRRYMGLIIVNGTIDKIPAIDFFTNIRNEIVRYNSNILSEKNLVKIYLNKD